MNYGVSEDPVRPRPNFASNFIFAFTGKPEFQEGCYMTSPTEITTRNLYKLIGTPASPVIIDVCTDEDFQENPRLIPTAKRCSYQNISGQIPFIQNKKVVIVCQKGLKLSMGAAAILRSQGIAAESLEGGNHAWRDEKLPLIPASKLNVTNFGEHQLWVTRHRPKIDRVACAWLINRFVDTDAKFLFVAPSQVLNVSKKYKAIPFDIEDTFWGHRDQKCTFDTMLEEFELNIPALKQMARIIRAADINKLNLVPEANGLLAISLGLSRMYKNDLEQTKAGMLIYDALYRWAREAADESHNCDLV